MSACWNSNFRIKTKANVKELFESNVFSGELYFYDDEYDYHLEKYRNRFAQLSYRSKSERGDIFSPYFCLTDEEARKVVWSKRTIINIYLRGKHQ